MFSVEKYDKKLFIYTFLNLFKDGFKTNREKELLVSFIKEHNKSKNTFYCLKNKKISQFLLDFVIKNIAPKIKSLVNFRYLSIYPDKQNKKLIKYYLNLIPNSLLLHYKKENWILLKI